MKCLVSDNLTIKKQKPSGLELIVGKMEYQFLEEILKGLNTKLKL